MFDRIYDLQDAGEVFATPEEVLEAMGGAEFSSWMSTPISSVLRDRGFSERFIKELLAVATMANYGQDPDMMAFAGECNPAREIIFPTAVPDPQYILPIRL